MSIQNFTKYFYPNLAEGVQEVKRKNKTAESDDEDDENAALLCALVEMEKGGILRSSEIGGEKYWVLYKALESSSSAGVESFCLPV